MQRFFKVFSILVVALLLLASGVNATLDQVARSPRENSLTYYSDRGHVVLALDGSVAFAQGFAKPQHPSVLHRG